jgi:hypothetical protein
MSSLGNYWPCPLTRQNSNHLVDQLKFLNSLKVA